MTRRNRQQWTWQTRPLGFKFERTFGTRAPAERWGNTAQASVRSYNKRAVRHGQYEVQVVRYSKELGGGAVKMTIEVVRDAWARGEIRPR